MYHVYSAGGSKCRNKKSDNNKEKNKVNQKESYNDCETEIAAETKKC